MEVQQEPPPIDELVSPLRMILRSGLPVKHDFDAPALLELRGVFARSINPADRLNRVKALDSLIRSTLVTLPNDELSEAARVLFGLAPGSRGKTLTDRREQAARESGFESDHFRKRIEPKILELVAWQLHQDSQNYSPRDQSRRFSPPELEVSGDTPNVTKGDLASLEYAIYQEDLSRLWAQVYLVRALVIKAERLKQWPFDESEPRLSRRHLDQAIEKRDEAIEKLRTEIREFVAQHGEFVAHGQADFAAEGLERLVAWTGGQPD